MAADKMPSSQELESAVLNVLNSYGKPLTNAQISEQVIILLNLSQELQLMKHSPSRTELDYRLAWARTRASKKNLIARIAPKTWEAVVSNS